MDNAILGVSFLLGIVLLILGFRHFPFKDGLLIFLLSGYIAVILGGLVVESGLIVYPVKLIPASHFQSSLLFELLLLPVICLWFYRLTQRYSLMGAIFMAFIFSGVLTLLEYGLEKQTDVIEYHMWTWKITLATVFLFLLMIRYVTVFIKKKHKT